MIEKKSYLDSIFFFCFFLPLCVLYYLACNHFFPDIPEIFNYTNKHDHDIYVSTTKHIQEGNILIGLNNDVGIALIYIGIREFFLNFVLKSFLVVVKRIFS